MTLFFFLIFSVKRRYSLLQLGRFSFLASSGVLFRRWTTSGAVKFQYDCCDGSTPHGVNALRL